MQLLIATANPGKVIEIREALANIEREILDLSHFPHIVETPEETGRTFEENARQKARFYHKHAKIPTIADDSGIIIEALKNELGIHTRRWGAGSQASDEEWINFFLARMKKEKNKNATFVCSLAYIDEHGKEHIFQGECRGTITDTLEADYLPGLPISACFRPEGLPQVFSALNLECKNHVSHRGQAALKLRDFLRRDQRA